MLRKTGCRVRCRGRHRHPNPRQHHHRRQNPSRESVPGRSSVDLAKPAEATRLVRGWELGKISARRVSAAGSRVAPSSLSPSDGGTRGKIAHSADLSGASSTLAWRSWEHRAIVDWIDLGIEGLGMRRRPLATRRSVPLSAMRAEPRRRGTAPNCPVTGDQSVGFHPTRWESVI